MPDYLVTDSQTGRKFKLTGDSPPTDAELTGIFGAQTESAGAPEPTSNQAADFARRIPEGMATGTGRTIQGLARAADIAQDAPPIPFMGGFGMERAAQTQIKVNQEIAAANRVRSATRQQRMEESPAYQFGAGTVEAAQGFYGVDRARDDEFVGQLATAAGEMVPTLVTGAFTGPIGAGVQYAASGGESQAQEAIAAGREDVADAAFLAAAGLGGLTEAALGVPGRLLSIINKARKAGVNPGKFGQWANRNPVKSGILRVGAEGAAREAAQEGLEQAGGNLIASDLAGYDPDRPVGQGVGRAMALGGVLGGVIGGGAAGVNQVNRNQQAAQLRTARTVRLTADGPELVVNEQTGTTEFPALENDWLPKPGVESQELRVERPALRGEAAMETRPTAEMGLDRTQPSTLNPELSTDLADTIAALRAGYRPEVEQVAPEKFDIEQWRRDVAAAVARPPAPTPAASAPPATKAGTRTVAMLKRSDFKTDEDWVRAVEATEQWANDPSQFSDKGSPSLYKPWTGVLQVVPVASGGYAVEYAGLRVGFGKTEEAAIKAAEKTHREFHKAPLLLSPATKSAATTAPRTGSPSREEIGTRPGELTSQPAASETSALIGEAESARLDKVNEANTAAKPAPEAVMEVIGTVKGVPPEDIKRAVMQSIMEGGAIEGMKRDGSKDGHYVVIPKDKVDSESQPMAIGPFKDKSSAATFLEAEVGAPGAKVVQVKAEKTAKPGNKKEPVLGSGMKLTEVRPGQWKFSYQGRSVMAMTDGRGVSVRLFNGDTATATNALVESHAAAQQWAKEQLYGAPTPSAAKPAPDRIETLLDAAEAKLKGPGGLMEGVTGLPVWVTREAARGVIKVMRVAYLATRDIAAALRAGLDWLRNQNLKGFIEAEANEFITGLVKGEWGEGSMDGNKTDGLKLLDGELDLGFKSTPTVFEIAMGFQDRFGRAIDYTNLRPEDNGRLVASLVQEIKRAVKLHPEALGWYDENLNLAMDVMRDLDPDLAKPENNFIFKAILAATSDGNKVGPQFKQTWQEYSHWKKHHQIYGGFVSGDRGENIRLNLGMLNDLIAHVGWEQTRDFMVRKGTVAELRQALVDVYGWTKEEANKIGTAERIDERVPFAIVLGPKLGSFFANLYGDYSSVTMDRWFMRTIGRLTGTLAALLPEGKLREMRNRLRDAVSKLTPEQFSLLNIPRGRLVGSGINDSATTISGRFAKKELREVAQQLEESGQPALVDVRLAANALKKGLKPMAEAPDNGTHRRWIRERVDEVQQILKADGIEMENADLQAVLWYLEKELYEKLKYRVKQGDNDYAAAANSVYEAIHGRQSPKYTRGLGRIRAIGDGSKAVVDGAAEGRAAPIQSQEQVDSIEATLDFLESKLKDAPDSMLEGVTGAPVWLTKAALRGVVQVVRVAYRASKDLALALRAGLEWLRDQNLRGFDEAQAHGWLAKTITEGSSVDGLNIRATSDLLAASPLIPDEVRELIANVTYEVVTDKNAVDFANRILDALGDPSAALPILADASNGLGGKQRVVLAFLTLLRLSQAITQAKAAGDTATVQRLAETEAAVYDYTLADRITDAAQTLQAVGVFSKLSPEGRLIHARRRIQRAGDLDLDPLKAQLNDALEKLEKAKQELADETARGREIQEQAAKAIVDALEASAFQPGTPVGKAIAIHVLGQLRQAGVISAVEAEVMRQHYAATDPSLTLAQKLERANIPQPEKRAKQIESERTKAIEAERARLKKRVAALGANPNIDALSLDAVDAALLAGMRQLKLNLGKLVREHWSKVERTGKTLAESLVTEGGLTGEAAQKLAAAFERRFNQLAQAKLKRELEQVLKPVTRSAIAKPGLVEKLMGLLRLGAFSNEAYWKAVMERLKLPEFSEALRDRLTAIGARLDALPEADIEGRHRVSVEFLNALEQAAGIDPLDLSLGFYVTNLLTGIPTHVANTSANFFAAIANAGIQMELAIAEGRYDDIPAAIEAAAVGLKKALPQAGQVMRTGILPAVRQGQARALRPMELAQFGTRGGVPLRDTGMVSRSAKWALESYPAKILNLWKLNGRAMAAEDLLAFTPAMEVQRVLLARRVARAEGLRGEALRNRVASLLADADPAQVEDAREFALRVVNSATPYGLVGAVVNLINQAKGSEHRALRGAANIVAPVLTIPMNAFNESLNYTPVGLWRLRSGVTNLLGREVKNLSLQQQQDLRAELLAKALTGTLFLTAAALMFAQFLDDDDPALALYGTGPQDMTDNKGWRERGALPHSLKVGDTYFSFALTPIAAPLSALGNWFDRERDVRIYGKKRSDSLGTQAGVALLSSLDVLFEQPFMVGFVDLFRLAGNTQGSDETKVRSGFRRAAKTASSFVVPNEVRNIDRYFDPKVYPVRDLEGALISSVPFVRGMGGKPALNALGQPIESQPFHRFLSRQAADPLIRGLDAKGAWPTVLDDRNKVWPAKRRAMTEGEFYSYQAETGKALDRKLRAEWPAWSRLPDAIARDKVNEAATKERAIWRSRNGWGRL